MQMRSVNTARRLPILRWVTAAALLGGCLLALGGAATAASAEDLVVAYGFNEGAGATAADASGNGRTGGLAGGATWTTGRYGSAVSLDGVSGRVDVPALGTFYKSGFTLEAWVKPRVAQSDVSVLGTWVNGDNGGPMIWVDHISGRYRLTLAKGAVTEYLDSGRTPAVGQWQHLSATYDGSVARFYVDGFETASKSFTGNVGDSNTWRVGAYGPGPGGFFDGAIDEVRVYDQPLTAQEVLADFAAPIGLADLNPPTAPGGFVLTSATANELAVAWQASTDDTGVSGYRLTRNGTTVGVAPGTTFTFTGLGCNATYTLGVEALDAAGNVSPRTTLSAQTSACPPGPSEHLVAAYGFDEATGVTAADESGNNHPATLAGAGWAGGRFGSSLLLNGSGGRADVPALGTFYKSGFTFEAWVKPTSAPSDAAILGTWVNGDDGGPMIWVDHVAGRFYLTLNKGFGNYLDSGRTPVVGQWQHVAATFDGLVARFYVDGVETASRTFIGTAGNSNTWRIGSYGSSPAGFFPGSIDEVRIYDRALGAAEVTADVNRGVGTVDTDPPTQPAHFASTDAGAASIAVHWDASTDNVGVTGYRLLRNGVSVGTTTATAFTFTGLTCNSSYELKVEAFDAAGNTSARSTADGVDDGLRRDAAHGCRDRAAAGATVSGLVPLMATAADDDGVASVRFEIDGVALGGEVQSPPFTVTWNSHAVVPGSHTVRAIATDTSGNTAASALVTVTVENPAAPPGLLAGYALDEGAGTTTVDASGLGHTASIAGDAWTGNGHVGAAASLNGTSHRVDLPALGTFYKTGFTFEAWIKPRVAPADAAIIGTWVNDAAGGPMIWVDHVSGRFFLTLNKGFGNYLDSGRTPVVGEWQHVAATYDGVVARFFVNGTETASRTFVGNVGDSNTWRIGAYGSGPGGFFDGTIDDARIYGRALSAAELGQDLATPVGNDVAPPQVIGATPENGAADVSIASGATVSFGEPIDPATVTASTIELRDAGGTAVPASVTYDPASSKATLSPTAALVYGATYTLTAKGGTTGPRVTDIAGNALAANFTASFTTEASAAPILLVTSSANRFSSWTAEILRAEGLNEFSTLDVSQISPTVLGYFDVVVLGEVALTAGERDRPDELGELGRKPGRAAARQAAGGPPGPDGRRGDARERLPADGYDLRPRAPGSSDRRSSSTASPTATS